jgi:dTDP-4-dehydrorhamnose reductase
LDGETVEKLLQQLSPDWVLHTAAMTHVDGCETERALARAINVEAVAQLATACNNTGTGLVHLSTDYVFDGEDGPYGEADEPRPLSHYGALKLESEALVLEGVERALVVRTMWLYGYAPEARPNTLTWVLEALVHGEKLQIVDDQWGNPTYGPDLASALVALCRSDARGLWHMGGGSFMTRYEQAVELAIFFTLDPDLIERTTTATLAQPARRPRRSGLRTASIESQLGRKVLEFRESLRHLVQDPHFRRNYSHLIP